MGYKTERTNEIIKNALARMISRELKDPGLDGKMISIVRAETTSDLSYTTVYVSAIVMEESEKEEILAALNRAKGFLRRSLSKNLKARHTPELIFKFDDSIAYSMHIESVLKEINKNEN